MPIQSGSDADILWYGIDRTDREKAILSEVPKGQTRDLRQGLDAIRQQHAQLRQYIRTTSDDLRSRVVPRQGSDAYQWALLISTHEQRHRGNQVTQHVLGPQAPTPAVHERSLREVAGFEPLAELCCSAAHTEVCHAGAIITT